MFKKECCSVKDNLRLPMSLIASPITRFIRTTDIRTRNRAKRSFVSQKLSESLTIMSMKSNSPRSIVNILRIPSPMFLEIKISVSLSSLP